MTYEELQTRLELSDEIIAKLKIYAGLLKEWNNKFNLTSILEDGQIVEKHFYDSLLPGKVFDFNGKNLLDMGTGAGFPGLVIALVYPECAVTLLDATKKKFSFLEEVAKQCEIPNVKYLCGRVEEQDELRDKFQVVTCRGFSSLNTALEVGLPLCRLGGFLLAYKGEKAHEELKESTKALNKLGGKVDSFQEEILPDCQEKRINIFIKKKEDTPARYPRRWAEIVAKPL